VTVHAPGASHSYTWFLTDDASRLQFQLQGVVQVQCSDVPLDLTDKFFVDGEDNNWFRRFSA